MTEAKKQFDRPTSAYCDYNDHTWGRIQFLMAIERVASQVLRELRDDVFPLYRKHRPRSQRAYLRLWLDYKLQEPVLQNLRPLIERWANHHHLGGPGGSPPPRGELPLVDWMEPIILATLMTWGKEGAEARLAWCIFDQFAAGAYIGTPDPFVLRTEGWAVLRETEQDFRARVTREFEEAREQHIRQQTAAAEALGNCPMPSKVKPEHFDWLVKFQVLRQSQSKIKEKTGVERSAVSDGIRRAALLVAGDPCDYWLMPPLPAGRKRRTDWDGHGNRLDS
jgi:hypothetical protein